jgi:hypothetical protein
MAPTLARLALAVIVIQAAACTPAMDWREFQPEGSGLVVRFPCRPDRQSRPVALAGHRVRMDMLACSAGDSSFAIVYADLPEPAAVAPALAELRERALSNVEAAPVPAAPLQVPGMTPNAQAARLVLDGRLPDGKGVREEAVFFSKGLRVYQASVIGPAPGAEAIGTFLSGLKLPA